MPTRIKKLEHVLKTPLEASRTEYVCIHIDELCVVFGPTENTGKVMIPTDLVLEWISAYELGLVRLDMDPRTMRDKIKSRSDWGAYQHGFETHLYAIIKAWDKAT